jgi:hypothetical protein
MASFGPHFQSLVIPQKMQTARPLASESITRKIVDSIMVTKVLLDLVELADKNQQAIKDKSSLHLKNFPDRL